MPFFVLKRVYIYFLRFVQSLVKKRINQYNSVKCYKSVKFANEINNLFDFALYFDII